MKTSHWKDGAVTGVDGSELRLDVPLLGGLGDFVVVLILKDGQPNGETLRFEATAGQARAIARAVDAGAAFAESLNGGNA